jgi:quinol-cytochrome oxidoreductase complex cytochrome b subunit
MGAKMEPFYGIALLIPWYLTRISRTSLKNSIKTGIIIFLVAVYTLFAVAGIATPQPLRQSQILISMWLIFTFFLTLISAYYAWPRTNK